MHAHVRTVAIDVHWYKSKIGELHFNPRVALAYGWFGVTALSHAPVSIPDPHPTSANGSPTSISHETKGPQ